MAQALAEMQLTEGDVVMFAMDAPNVPPQQTAVMLVQTSQAQQVAAANDRMIGVCKLIGNPDPENTAINGVSPIVAVRIYFNNYENQNIEGAAQVTILKNPAHGMLEDLGSGEYRYRPTPGYLGSDSATMLVKMGGYNVKVVVALHVVEGPLLGDTSDLFKEYCRKLVYRMSAGSSSDAGAADLLAWQRSTGLSGLLASASQTLAGFQDLGGSSVGNATGEGASAQITLDTTAAGHGWYVDPTPLDSNDDYLPTSNPNVWQAKGRLGSGLALRHRRVGLIPG